MSLMSTSKWKGVRTNNYHGGSNSDINHHKEQEPSWNETEQKGYAPVSIRQNTSPEPTPLLACQLSSQPSETFVEFAHFDGKKGYCKNKGHSADSFAITTTWDDVIQEIKLVHNHTKIQSTPPSDSYPSFFLSNRSSPTHYSQSYTTLEKFAIPNSYKSPPLLKELQDRNSFTLSHSNQNPLSVLRSKGTDLSSNRSSLALTPMESLSNVYHDTNSYTLADAGVDTCCHVGLNNLVRSPSNCSANQNYPIDNTTYSSYSHNSAICFDEKTRTRLSHSCGETNATDVLHTTCEQQTDVLLPYHDQEHPLEIWNNSVASPLLDTTTITPSFLSTRQQRNGCGQGEKIPGRTLSSGQHRADEVLPSPSSISSHSPPAGCGPTSSGVKSGIVLRLASRHKRNSSNSSVSSQSTRKSTNRTGGIKSLTMKLFTHKANSRTNSNCSGNSQSGSVSSSTAAVGDFLSVPIPQDSHSNASQQHQKSSAQSIIPETSAKRRNFAFMRSTPERTRKQSSAESLEKTREHSRMLALMAYQEQQLHLHNGQSRQEQLGNKVNHTTVSSANFKNYHTHHNTALASSSVESASSNSLLSVHLQKEQARLQQNATTMPNSVDDRSMNSAASSAYDMESLHVPDNFAHDDATDDRGQFNQLVEQQQYQGNNTFHPLNMKRHLGITATGDHKHNNKNESVVSNKVINDALSVTNSSSGMKLGDSPWRQTLKSFSNSNAKLGGGIVESSGMANTPTLSRRSTVPAASKVARNASTESATVANSNGIGNSLAGAAARRRMRHSSSGGSNGSVISSSSTVLDTIQNSTYLISSNSSTGSGGSGGLKHLEKGSGSSEYLALDNGSVGGGRTTQGASMLAALGSKNQQQHGSASPAQQEQQQQPDRSVATSLHQKLSNTEGVGNYSVSSSVSTFGARGRRRSVQEESEYLPMGTHVEEELSQVDGNASKSRRPPLSPLPTMSPALQQGKRVPDINGTPSPQHLQRSSPFREKCLEHSDEVHHPSIDQGFSFDAFGLDANEIDNEVSAAIAELAASNPDLPNLSFFFEMNQDRQPLNQGASFKSRTSGSALTLSTGHNSLNSSPPTCGSQGKGSSLTDPTAPMTPSSSINETGGGHLPPLQYHPTNLPHQGSRHTVFSPIVSVEREISDSSSLTDAFSDKGDTQQQHHGNIFKEAQRGSSFHKAKRVVRPSQYPSVSTNAAEKSTTPIENCRHSRSPPRYPLHQQQKQHDAAFLPSTSPSRQKQKSPGAEEEPYFDKQQLYNKQSSHRRPRDFRVESTEQQQIPTPQSKKKSLHRDICNAANLPPRKTILSRDAFQESNTNSEADHAILKGKLAGMTLASALAVRRDISDGGCSSCSENNGLSSGLIADADEGQRKQKLESKEPVDVWQLNGRESEAGEYIDVGSSSHAGAIGEKSDGGTRWATQSNNDSTRYADSDVGVSSDVGVASDVGVMSTVESGYCSAGELPWNGKELEYASKQNFTLRTPSPLLKERVEWLKNELGDEIMNPERLTVRKRLKPVKTEKVSASQKRAQECFLERTSLSSQKERLLRLNTQSSKSDAGVAYPMDEIAAAWNKMQREKKDQNNLSRPPLTKGEVLPKSFDLRRTNQNPDQVMPVTAVASPVMLRKQSNEPVKFSSKGSPVTVLRNSEKTRPDRETQSDAEASLSFLSSVKLGKTDAVSTLVEGVLQPSSASCYGINELGPSECDNYDDSRIGHNMSGLNGRRSSSISGTSELAYNEEMDQDDNALQKEILSPVRKLTYREQQELLKKSEDLSQEKTVQDDKGTKTPERDVAMLIRRRIAANRRNSTKNPTHGAGNATSPVPTETPHQHDSKDASIDITSMRSRLKKVLQENQQSRSTIPTVTPPSKPTQNTVSPFRMSNVSPPPQNPPLGDRDRANTLCHVTTKLEIKHSCSSSSSAPDTHGKLENGPAKTDESRPPVLSGTQSFLPQQVEEKVHKIVTMHPIDVEEQIREVKSVATLAANCAFATPQPLSSGVRHSGLSALFAQRSADATPVNKRTSDNANSSVSALFARRSVAANLEPKTGSNDTTAAASAALSSKTKCQQKISDVTDKHEFGPPRHSTSDLVETESKEPSFSNVECRPALNEDPLYEKYFKMLKIGMPMPVVQHAMTRDGLDPAVMDGDHNEPVKYRNGDVALKDDPAYAKYFKMLKMGLPVGAVKNAMIRDGLDGSVMDGDHNAPVGVSRHSTLLPERKAPEPKDKFRRTRLHWDTLRKVRSTSVWALVNEDPDVDQIEIDETEFAELFQSEVKPVEKTEGQTRRADGQLSIKKRNAVKVIDPKRANNGGIILARLKMTYDELAKAVDKVDEQIMSPEQMQGIVEFIPTKEEKQALRTYMTQCDTDSAQAFDGLCECEKFMVAMMTVKHSKQKIRALLFKLQFLQCMEDLEQETTVVEKACDELSNSVRLRKLLGIVLNIGNRLNTAGATQKGKAGAFTIDSLLKLNQAKAFDKKTTFLHYVVLIVQRHNELLARFKDDLPHVLKADKIYWDQCVSDLEEVENQLENVRRIALYQARGMFRGRPRRKRNNDDDDDSLSEASVTLEEEVEALRSTSTGTFTLDAIKKVSALRDKVECTKNKFRQVLEYFGEEDKSKMQPHELFQIIVTFCRDFDAAREEVAAQEKVKMREERKRQASQKQLLIKEEVHPQDLKPAIPVFSPQSERTRPLRISSMQPNMGNLFAELKSKAIKIATTPSTNLTRDDCAVIKQNEEMLRREMLTINPGPTNEMSSTKKPVFDTNNNHSDSHPEPSNECFSHSHKSSWTNGTKFLVRNNLSMSEERNMEVQNRDSTSTNLTNSANCSNYASLSEHKLLEQKTVSTGANMNGTAKQNGNDEVVAPSVVAGTLSDQTMRQKARQMRHRVQNNRRDKSPEPAPRRIDDNCVNHQIEQEESVPSLISSSQRSEEPTTSQQSRFRSRREKLARSRRNNLALSASGESGPCMSPVDWPSGDEGLGQRYRRSPRRVRPAVRKLEAD